jgi:hypothetical protein
MISIIFQGLERHYLPLLIAGDAKALIFYIVAGQQLV